MKQPMFANLNRKEAIKLRCLMNDRAEQIKLLKVYGNTKVFSYTEWAVFHTLEDLLPYAAVMEHGLPNEYPDCVKHAYLIMFNAFDDFLTDLIGDHYELQGWELPMEDITWCEDHFDREEAIQAYNKAVAENDGTYIVLRKVDKEGMPIDDNIVACNF